MKTYCASCGAHFPHEFEQTLKKKCTFWKEHGLQKVSSDQKRLLWDWLFSFNMDEFAIKNQVSISFEFHGQPYEGNIYDKLLPKYKTLPDTERQAFQKSFVRFVSKIDDNKKTKIGLEYFVKHSKWKNKL